MITDEQIGEVFQRHGCYIDEDMGSMRAVRELIALAQQVKPLDWVFLDHYQTWISRGFDYDYIIPVAGDCYHLYYGDDVLCSSNSIDGLKEAVQQDYQRRVLSCLVHGGV